MHTTKCLLATRGTATLRSCLWRAGANVSRLGFFGDGLLEFDLFLSNGHAPHTNGALPRSSYHRAAGSWRLPSFCAISPARIAARDDVGCERHARKQSYPVCEFLLRSRTARRVECSAIRAALLSKERVRPAARKLADPCPVGVHRRSSRERALPLIQHHDQRLVLIDDVQIRVKEYSARPPTPNSEAKENHAESFISVQRRSRRRHRGVSDAAHARAAADRKRACAHDRSSRARRHSGRRLRSKTPGPPVYSSPCDPQKSNLTPICVCRGKLTWLAVSTMPKFAERGSVLGPP